MTMQIMRRIVLALGLIGSSAVMAGETVLYDAATDVRAVRAQDGATFRIADGILRVETHPSAGYPGVTVSGKWDLSNCGELEIELVDCRIGGPCTIRLLNPGGGPHTGGCYIVKPKVWNEKRFVGKLPLLPDLTGWQEIQKKLTRVRTWALASLMLDCDSTGSLASSNGQGRDVKVSTLNPKSVVQVAVYINTPKLPHSFGIRRIVAKGTPRKAEDLPAFARMTAKEFFPCIDGYGQFKHREWPDKTHSDADLARQREKEAKDLAAHPGPAGWDKWGGWATGPQLKATGSFYTTKRDGKWWLVDPDGRLWWSHGPVRVTPSGGITAVDGHEDWFERLPGKDEPEALFYTTKDELLHPYYALHGLHRTYDFSSQNIRRKYGENWFATWAELAHRRLRSWSCNTIANSSDKRICLMDKTPYTERFEIHAKPLKGHKGGWWAFADPFDADFRAEARRMTEVYRAEVDDPWCLGFFVDNEQKWGDETTLALSTLKSPADQAAKVEFVRRLKEKYGDVANLNAAWRTDYASWRALLETVVPPRSLAGVRADLAAFSAAVAETYFRIVHEEIKRANPGKLYLGCRWAGSAPDFVVRAAAKSCDVLSYNVYRTEMSGFSLPKGVDMPVLIGEFHFGALDRGPFCPGLILLKDQATRAETYRGYVRSALLNPMIVGVHWHQFSDQSTAGRFDGENMQVGWTDVCDTPYWETVGAVRDIGSRLYEVRSGGNLQ